MIDKLRKKIFWIIQIPLTIIILGVMVIFIISSYKNTIVSSTMFMNRIESKDQGIIDKPSDFSETRTFINPFLIELDGVYKLQIKNNIVINESSKVTDEVRNYAIKLNSKNSEEGYIGNYIYKIRKFDENTKEITLMENSDVINRYKWTVILTCVFGLGLVFALYIIAEKISNKVVKPAKDSFEKQKQFISDASHELKTPLAVIEANSDVLKSKIGESKWITYIQNEVESMNKLVNDLLALSKMENESTVNFQKFNLSKEAKMSVAVFESIIYEKGITLETNIEENIMFNGEKEDIKHVVSIILDNAIKHTEKDGKIIVGVNKEKSDIKIEIKNEGEPIPVEEQEKIFERFYRIDKARNRNEKRYGLGLAIAKKIVDKYKGSIKASSKDGFNSFIVKIDNK